MGSVIPLKKSVNSAYLDLKNLVSKKLSKVESLIDFKLQSKVDLIIDGGSIFAENSTIIDFSDGEAKIIREGKGFTELKD